MKVLALMPDAYGGFGGIAQYNRDLIDALSESDAVESILSLARNHPDPPVRLPAKLAEVILQGSPARYLKGAIARAREVRPDVVICGHINLLPAAMIVKKITGRPVVLEIYGIDAWQRPGGLRAWGVEEVDLVIAISRFTREEFLRWSGVRPHRVKIVPNAIRLDRYRKSGKPAHLVERYGVEGKRVLLTVGRLLGTERYKGHDRVISLLPKLAAEFPALVYLVVGDGTDRSRIEGLAASLGVKERVIFAGRISEGEKLDHYNLADAFAMPSLSEGFGFVFLEAAACGLPVLGGSRDGSRDALLDGRLGVMIDPESPEELLDGLKVILKQERRVSGDLERFDFARFKTQVEDLTLLAARS